MGLLSPDSRFDSWRLGQTIKIMKILLLRQPEQTILYPGNLSGGACYLTDMLLHGLREKFGHTVVEYERAWWMYYEDWGPGKKYNHEEYGHLSFTIYKTLHNDDLVDRTDIEQKIKDQYFDLVIFGYTHYGLRPNSWELVTKYYPKNKIAFIDGADTHIFLKQDAIGNCVYFKRELFDDIPEVHPISFAMPEEKIDTIESDKDKIIAPMDPRNKDSYIYKDEHSYYLQYAESMFGITMKKAGWDCLRHYEILGNNCVPLFLDIDRCPKNTMTTLPKEQLLTVLQLTKDNGIDWWTTDDGKDNWYELNDSIQEHYKKHCTTKSLAEYFLSVMNSSV